MRAISVLASLPKMHSIVSCGLKLQIQPVSDGSSAVWQDPEVSPFRTRRASVKTFSSSIVLAIYGRSNGCSREMLASSRSSILYERKKGRNQLKTWWDSGT